MFIANPSDPKIFPLARVLLKLFCQISQHFDSFSSEKTPIFICGANASFRDSSSDNPDFFACL